MYPLVVASSSCSDIVTVNCALGTPVAASTGWRPHTQQGIPPSGFSPDDTQTAAHDFILYYLEVASEEIVGRRDEERSERDARRLQVERHENRGREGDIAPAGGSVSLHLPNTRLSVRPDKARVCEHRTDATVERIDECLEVGVDASGSRALIRHETTALEHLTRTNVL